MLLVMILVALEVKSGLLSEKMPGNNRAKIVSYKAIFVANLL